ncbi:Endonuclease/exonuclease/phosphatase superfamily [Sesbania bispinosa]|nr:Endonuclease/exonuclease/phosphatase superfamily [Sesbania bispinosa]
MDNLTRPSPEEEDLLDRSTKKIISTLMKTCLNQKISTRIQKSRFLARNLKIGASPGEILLLFVFWEKEWVFASCLQGYKASGQRKAQAAESVFGPWMMAKKPQCRRPPARKPEPPKDVSLIKPPSNGSRFDILSEETPAHEVLDKIPSPNLSQDPPPQNNLPPHPRLAPRATPHKKASPKNHISVTKKKSGAPNQSFWGSHPEMSSVPIHPLAPDDSTKDNASPKGVEPLPVENSQFEQMDEDPSSNSFKAFSWYAKGYYPHPPFIFCCSFGTKAISVKFISSSHQSIHLYINDGSNPPWILTVTYGSPRESNRLELWEDLRNFHSLHPNISWSVARDFNTILYDSEKVGGGPMKRSVISSFNQYSEDYLLSDFGYKGQEFTWSKSPLRERLNRLVVKANWRSSLAAASVINLPLPSSDHSGLWIKIPVKNDQCRRNGVFKFLAPWIEHPDFSNQVCISWIKSNTWPNNIKRFSSNIVEWNSLVFGNIFRKKKRLLNRLQGIQGKLLQGPNPFLSSLRISLWEEYSQVLDHEEAYWYHLSRSKWLSLGDHNTKFFHQATLIPFYPLYGSSL